MSVIVKIKVMSKKKKQNDKETTIENYYDLRVDKVDELVEALKSGKVDEDKPVPTSIAECTGTDTPDTKTKRGKDKKFDPYKIDKLSRIPAWIKALVIKFWFSGAICYFFIMGLGVYVSSTVDMIFIVGIVLGIVTDIMINPVFRMLESNEKEYDNFMMFPFPFKAYWTFITNILYYLVVIICVNYIYLFIDGVCHIYIAIEPLMFGIIVLIIDMAFIGIKDGIVYAVRSAKKKKRLAAEGIELEVAPDNSKAGEQTDGVGAEAGSAAQPQPPIEDDGEIDEVERLRRLAEMQNRASEDDGKKKHKKK